MTKILIVDDEESLRALYSATLRRAGYEVLTAGNAKKAVELALSAKPALILLDVMMPSVDGGEAYAYLSGNPATADIPIFPAPASSSRTSDVRKMIGMSAVAGLPERYA